jgi:phosphatidylinositol glycan class B
LWQATSANGLRFIFATIILTTIGSLSLISHKEVRFIFPLLPLLHILTAPTISSFFYTTIVAVTRPPPAGIPVTAKVIVTRRKFLLYSIVILNLSVGFYSTFFHQRGVIRVTSFLRNEFEELALDPRGVPLSSPDANKYEVEGWGEKKSFDEAITFAGFLMPCHSTPWHSQLFYPGLKAWALTCEPPIGLEGEAREQYRDEADRFYDDPRGFLEREMNTRDRPWPKYIVGFEGIEQVLKEYYEETMKGFKVKEKWRSMNSHWHDDDRRRGAVVVWEFVDGSTISEAV